MPLFHELHLCSSGSKNFEGVAYRFHLSSREELWKAHWEDKAKKSKGKKPKPVGLRSGEWNVLSLLSQDIISDILDHIGENLYQDSIPDDQQLPDIVDENEKLYLVLTDRNFHLLEDTRRNSWNILKKSRRERNYLICTLEFSAMLIFSICTQVENGKLLPQFWKLALGNVGILQVSGKKVMWMLLWKLMDQTIS